MYGNNYGYQPYFGQQRQTYQNPTQMPSNEQFTQQVQTPIQTYNQPIRQGLQGEMVESLDVVRVLPYPLNGSRSYFPSTDGTKIFTKQLQDDGNVKICTYNLQKSNENDNENDIESPKYATVEDIEKIFSKLDFKDFEQLKEDISEIKKTLKKGKKDE